MCSRVLLSLALFGLVRSSIAVSVTKCRFDDPTCLRLSAQSLVPIIANGIPEYGMKLLDPLPITTIDGSSPDLKLIATGVVVTGLKGCEVHRISRGYSKINVELLCSVQVTGDYDVKGKILILPLDGRGTLVVSLSKVLISVQADHNEIEINGKKHWDITNWSYTYDLLDRANIELTNLFAGSAKLTEAMREMFGQSANEIVKEVGPPIVKAITGEAVNAINLFFHHVPVEELVE